MATPALTTSATAAPAMTTIGRRGRGAGGRSVDEEPSLIGGGSGGRVPRGSRGAANSPVDLSERRWPRTLPAVVKVKRWWSGCCGVSTRYVVAVRPLSARSLLIASCAL